MNTGRTLTWIAAALLVASCDRGSTPARPPADRFAEISAACAAIWHEELGRAIDPPALTDCVARSQAGIAVAEIRATVRASPEYRLRHAQPPAAPAAAPQPGADESGPLRVDGIVFRRADGSIFQWRGCTDFLAFKRFREEIDHPELRDATLSAEHAGLRAILQQRIAAGCNVFRVLGMVDSFATFRPDGRYFDDLAAFADLIADLHARFEFVVFADAQIIMPDAAAQRAHLDRIVAILAAKPAALVEIANEPFKNIPGGDAAAAALCRAVRGRGVLVASGAYGVAPRLTPCDYGTTHSERTLDWPRAATDLIALRDTTQVPWVSDEPTGFAEAPDGVRRSVDADDAGQFAAAAALAGAGSTFHSEAGIRSQAWGPRQAAAARAWFDAARWVPAAAQLWKSRRDEDVDMPLEHDDRLAGRTLCKGDGSAEWCVAIRPAPAWEAVARNGWRIVEQPRRGLVRLVIG